MSPSVYEYLCRFLLENSGLSLGDGKEYLLEARLVPLAQSSGFDGIDDLVSELRGGKNDLLSSATVDAMTTNETSFFRDKTPFQELTTILIPALIRLRETRRRLRIWCAAASTGQEPYTIAMALAESFSELANWDVEIIATDISPTVLDRARQGVFSQFEVQRGLPVKLLMKYFTQVDSGWQINKELGKSIRWSELNLLEDFSKLGWFDIIFCRNVLIYFEHEMKKEILDRMSRMTCSDGYLLLGAAETVLGITDTFQRFDDCRSGVYTPTGINPSRTPPGFLKQRASEPRFDSADIGKNG